MAKLLRGIFLSWLLFFLVLGIVSAAGSLAQMTNNFINGMVQFIEPVSKQLLGETGSGDLLFAKVLLFLIVLALVWAALKKIPIFEDYSGILFVVSFAVSILGTRWVFTPSMIQAVILPYSTLAVALTAIIPIIIGFTIFNLNLAGQVYKTIRKLFWILFAVVFFGLYFSRLDIFDASWIYLATGLIAILIALFDGSIQKMQTSMKIDKSMEGSKDRLLVQLNKDLADLDTVLAAGRITSDDYKRQVHAIHKKIKALHGI